MIVANSTPLIELAKIGRFNLLRQVYGRLAVPQEVWDEVVVQGAGQAGAAEAQNADWIDVLAVSNPTSVAALQATYPHIGAGKAAAIVLAQEQSASLVLIDDRLARAAAQSEGVPVGGTLSTVLNAKAAGFIPTVKEVLDDLRASGFRLSNALYQTVLQAAGE